MLDFHNYLAKSEQHFRKMKDEIICWIGAKDVFVFGRW